MVTFTWGKGSGGVQWQSDQEVKRNLKYFGDEYGKRTVLTTMKASIAVESLFLNFFFFCPLSGFYVWQKTNKQTTNFLLKYSLLVS